MADTEAGQGAVCPICLGDLFSNRLEVGALTFKGQRIEPDLYHMGCITMMLCHKGAIKHCPCAEDGSTWDISWGASPVTRKPMDGFLRVPKLAEEQEWVHFADWRGDGQIRVSELARVVTSTLPVAEPTFFDFMQQDCKADADGTISTDMLETTVLPYLRRLMQEAGLEDSPQICWSTVMSEASRQFDRQVPIVPKTSEANEEGRSTVSRASWLRWLRCPGAFGRRRKSPAGSAA